MTARSRQRQAETSRSRARTGQGRAAVAVLIAAGLTVGTGALGATSAQAADAPPGPVLRSSSPPAKAVAGADKLGDNDRELLSEAREKGEKKVTVLLATTKGGAGGVDASVEQLGGLVGYRNDRLGYVRATLPTANVERAVALGGVLKADLKETIQIDDPPVSAATATTSPAAATKPVLGRQPTVNPYLPINETGAAAFRTADPTRDGRGVTIGILDSGVDLDHPALQTTTTGERKIVDWVTAVDPLLEGDASWRPMLTPVTGPAFTVAGKGYTAPAGDLLFNRFSESITRASEPGGDINRDGDTTDVFGVLYRASDNAIWVDQDQDGDFTDGPLLRPYREKFQVGHFGTDDPATPISETSPFVVEFREDVDLTPAGLAGRTADFVNIGIVEDAHGSHVAGITAANNAAIADGAAPGAKLVSSRACTWGGGCTNVALTEGMIDLVANRGVDIVNMSIGGLPALNDGANARSELYTRLIEEYGVQLFISAGNSGPGLNTIGDPSVAAGVVSVGSSISKPTWKSNYGSVVSAAQQMHNFSSRGPREDGGFKPEVVAPGSAVSTVPLWLKQPDVAETDVALPLGYAMFQGTSMASPQAAGAAAVLLSATKADGIAVTPAQLRKALYSTATPIPGVPVQAQGMGLVTVGKAYDLLQRNLATPSYVVDAPVCTPISDFLATPDRGTGVYNRCAVADGGQAVGKAKSYRVTVTRTTGPAGTRPHAVSFRGNDGTFRANRTSVDLPLGKPVALTLTAKPTTEGAHGAVLLLDDKASPGIEGYSLHTVVAARTLKAPAFSSALTGSVERNRTQSMFVEVPEGTEALQVVLSGIATGSQTRWVAVDPYGIPQDSSSSLTCFTNFGNPRACAPTSRAYLDPTPGTWELTVESRRTSPFLANPFTLTAAAQGVTVDPEVLTVPTATVGEPTQATWTVTNDFGPTSVTPKGGALGSAKALRPTIADAASQQYEVVVPAGSSRFDAVISNPADLSADLDLTVFRGAEQVGQSADGDSEEAVTIANPAAGTYTVVVDGYAVPAGTTAYDYRDVVTSPAYGTLAVPAATVKLASGASTPVSGTLTARQTAGEGRQLFGELQVLSDRGALLGTGSVLVQSLTPAGTTPTAARTGQTTATKG